MRASVEFKRWVIASHNAGKLNEIADLLRPYAIETISAPALNLVVPEETGKDFCANARLKAEAAAQISGLPALADDSGLVVPALGGAPGIYSARWAGPDQDFAYAMQQVEQAMLDRDAKEGRSVERNAYFTCALAVAWPDGSLNLFEGHAYGQLIWPPRGQRGFGYDPIFVPDGYAQTYGEMDPALKYGMSHRAVAFSQLKAVLFGD